MTSETTMDDFIRVLEERGGLDTTLPLKDQKAWDTMMVFSDWCEENGEQLIEKGLRWMSQNHKRPYQSVPNLYYWFLEFSSISDKESDIPKNVFSKLEGGVRVWYNTQIYYESYIVAIDRLSKALLEAGEI